MEKLKINKLLIGLLFIITAFFISGVAKADFDPNPLPYVSPKLESKETYKCSEPYNSDVSSRSVCYQQIADYENSKTSKRNHVCYIDGEGGSYNVVYCDGETYNSYYKTWTAFTHGIEGNVRAIIGDEIEVCPPDGHPNYTKLAPHPSNSSQNVCFSERELCPKGFYQYKTSKGCAPIRCSANGTEKSVFNLPPENAPSQTSAGVVKMGDVGTYCDGKCSYSVSADSVPYEGSKSLKGVATGSICGIGGVRGSFVPLGETSNCTDYALSGGGTYQVCELGDITPPTDTEIDPITAPDADDSKVDPEEEPEEFTPSDCGSGSTEIECLSKKLIEQSSNELQQQKSFDDERHNKIVEQQKELFEFENEQDEIRFNKGSLDTQLQTDSIVNAIEQIEIESGSPDGIDTDDITGGLTTSGLAEVLTTAMGGVDGGSEADLGDENGNLQPFYEPDYPEGFESVWDKNKSVFDNTEAANYLNSWKLSVSGNAPPMQFCFDLGAMGNFGCDSITIDPRVFPFLRIIILVSTLFLCRGLVFGG